jgi:AraC-like DNA-binding protein
MALAGLRRGRLASSHLSEPITSVAMDLGYGCSSAFSAMFRRITGVGPVSYSADNG